MPRHQAYNAHVSNINTHGSTRFVEHEGRTEFMNCPKNDNYTYDRSLVGNWVEERQNFAADGPLGGTVPLTTAATTETKTIYQQWDPLQNLSRVAQNKTVAQANGYAGQVGAKATSLPNRRGMAGQGRKPWRSRLTLQRNLVQKCLAQPCPQAEGLGSRRTSSVAHRVCRRGHLGRGTGTS